MKVRHILSHCVVAILASALTFFFAVPEQNAELQKLQELENLIDAEFVYDDYDLGLMYDAAAAAMVDSLGNQWSYYIPADLYDDYENMMDNSYVGIGVTIITREDGYIDIQKVEPDGPAQEAGIMPGDILVAVEGKDISQMTVDEVKNMIVGEKNTQVKLQLRRGEELLDLSVYRRSIKVTVATGTMLEGNVGLVQITNFDSRSKSETLAVISRVRRP